MAEHVERMGRRIKERRLELGLKQIELARQISDSVDSSQISRWERGKHDPSSDHKEALAAALDTTVGDLMAGPEAERETTDETPNLMDEMSATDIDEIKKEQQAQRALLERIWERLSDPAEDEDVPASLPDEPDPSPAEEAAS